MIFKIGTRVVDKKNPPLIVPEVGINHEGSIEKAFKMIDSAKKNGSEIIKFQCHITNKEMIKTNDKPGKISSETLWDIIKRCELSIEEEYKIKKYAEKNKLIYLSTPFSKEAVDRLIKLKVSAFKIGSGECNNFPLIEYIAKKKLPVILSTGMNDMKTIKKASSIFKKHNTNFSLLHCTSMYPTPYEKVRLGAIQELKKNFPGIQIGLSDHSKNIWTCLGAVSLGATILEKHFTISRNWKGPDMPVSIEPLELKSLIDGSIAIWQASGGKKNILKEEIPVIKFAYASVVSIKDIKKGEKLSLKNIWVKRPGKGEYKSKDFKKLLGLKVIRNIKQDRYLSSKDIKIK